MELKQEIYRFGILQRILLIVPYGIETFCTKVQRIFEIPFNRTLWN